MEEIFCQFFAVSDISVTFGFYNVLINKKGAFHDEGITDHGSEKVLWQ